jgi:ubiquitin C-terminal hydrolase
MHEQQDSNEFLSILFDRIESKLKPTLQRNLVHDVFGGKCLSVVSVALCLMISPCCVGLTCSQIICEECGATSEKLVSILSPVLRVLGFAVQSLTLTLQDNYYAVSVQVKDKKNVNESLAAFVQGERLTGGNKYNCSRCKKKV